MSLHQSWATRSERHTNVPWGGTTALCFGPSFKQELWHVNTDTMALSSNCWKYLVLTFNVLFAVSLFFLRFCVIPVMLNQRGNYVVITTCNSKHLQNMSCCKLIEKFHYLFVHVGSRLGPILFINKLAFVTSFTFNRTKLSAVNSTLINW